MNSTLLSHEFLFFSGFLLFIFCMLAIDLGLFSKKNQEISFKQAAIMSSIWVLFALIFFGILYKWGNELHNIQDFDRLAEITQRHMHKIKLIPESFEASLQVYNKNLALEYLTGYVVEYALSIDNIFVMVLIFSSFGVDPKYYHRVLVWGIIGAIVLRFTFIFLGAALISQFAWILYVFGAFLVYTGFMMFINRNQEDKIDPKNHRVIKFASRHFPVHPHYEGDRFFHRIGDKKYITPLFLVLLMIESTDVIFAVDSIPAIFSVTQDPYIVFFSNIFAILGLRSMFFLLVNVIHKFHYLKVGLSLLLVFIGVKMLLHHWLEGLGFTTAHSLLIILSILTLSVVASLVFPNQTEKEETRKSE